jgi:hypothetical protein
MVVAKRRPPALDPTGSRDRQPPDSRLPYAAGMSWSSPKRREIWIGPLTATRVRLRSARRRGPIPTLSAGQWCPTSTSCAQLGVCRATPSSAHPTEQKLGRPQTVVATDGQTPRRCSPATAVSRRTGAALIVEDLNRHLIPPLGAACRYDSARLSLSRQRTIGSVPTLASSQAACRSEKSIRISPL